MSISDVAYATSNVMLLEMYDLGTASNCVEENGFGLWQYEEEGETISVLVETPDTSYVVPETMAGIQVDKVSIMNLRGEAIFNNEFEFYGSKGGTNEVAQLESIKVRTTNYEFIFNIEGMVEDISLDLSECGESVEIPAEYLEGGTYADTFSTIYVSSSVKANYADNAKVVVK